MQPDEIHGRLKPAATLRISIADMMALRVRAQNPGKEPPGFLYQSLPELALTLIATIPAGTAAISIPQQKGRYPLSGSCPDTGDGFVIVYARKANGRYEAVEALYRKASYAISVFRDMACRWVEDNIGGLQPLQTGYAYFSPSREEWGVILRDGGFTIYDPSHMDMKVTAETLRRRNDSSGSGITARIPVCTGLRSGTPAHFPVFTRVEITPDSQPGADGLWLGFAESERLRALQSRPPERFIRPFREWLSLLTKESGFASWSFSEGTLFGNCTEWWGDKNRRRTLHEGIDFAEGYLPDGTLRSISEGTPVRSLESGELVAVLDDFLNKTLIVRHPEIRDEAGNVFHTLLSHIQPEISAPNPVARGQALGKVSKAKKVGAPAHLHLTAAWIPESIPAGEITMDMISMAFMPIALISFNDLLEADG